MRIILLILSLTTLFLVTNHPVLAGFVFSIPQTSINEDQEIEATIDLSIKNQGNTQYYLEGAFKKEGGSNYFGQTWNDTLWVKYTPNNSEKILKSIQTNPEGSWSGTLKIKIDPTSSYYQGSGNYSLKILRFTATGSNPAGESNITTLAVTGNPTPTPTNSPTEAPTATPSPTSTPKPTTTPKPSVTPKKTPTPGAKISDASTSSASLPPSILGVNISATPTQLETTTEDKKSNSPLKKVFIIGGGLLFILSGALVTTFIGKSRQKA